MGLLSFLRTQKRRYADKVWKTRSEAMKGLVREALFVLKEDKVPVIAVFFEDTLSEIASFLQLNAVPFQTLKADTLKDFTGQSNTVIVADALEVSSSPSCVKVLHAAGYVNKMNFLFAGHYPLPEKENAVMEKLFHSFPDSTLVFCSSLEDPVFGLFGSEQLVGLLEKLGLSDDEYIEHDLVSRSLLRAREKIATMVHHETITRSEREWFERNVSK